MMLLKKSGFVVKLGYTLIEKISTCSRKKNVLNTGKNILLELEYYFDLGILGSETTNDIV
jgi:hypothetical protein